MLTAQAIPLLKGKIVANTLPAQTAPQTTAEYEAEFERLKIETKVLAEETGRLKGETRTMLIGMGARL